MAFSRKTHYVQFEGGAQSVLSIPVDARGIPTLPSAATYGILDLRYDEDDSNRAIVALGTAGSIDSASTTLSAASTLTAARTITVADGSGLTEGHFYLLTDATTNQRTLIEVRSKNGNTIYLQNALNRVWANASTVQGIEVTATFPSAEAADENRTVDLGGGPYVVDWTWTGVDPTTQREFIWVRRTPGMQHIVTLEDCAILDPSLQRELKPEWVEQFLNQAHRDLHAELRAIGQDPSRWDGAENAQEYVKARFVMHGRRYLPGEEGGRNDRLAQAAEGRARIMLHTILSAGTSPVGTVITDATEDEAPDGTSPQGHTIFGLS